MINLYFSQKGIAGDVRRISFEFTVYNGDFYLASICDGMLTIFFSDQRNIKLVRSIVWKSRVLDNCSISSIEKGVQYAETTNVCLRLLSSPHFSDHFVALHQPSISIITLTFNCIQFSISLFILPIEMLFEELK